MKAILLSLSAFIFSSLPVMAQAAWNPIIACEGQRMVVDTNNLEPRYQLVIRNSPDILRYFSEKADISHAINEKNEMIVTVFPGGPGIDEEHASRLFVGYISGQTNVVVSEVARDVYRVSLWHTTYRSHGEELANWDFRGCSRR